MFKVGQKVVCIAKFNNADGCEPHVGEVVTFVGLHYYYSNRIIIKEYLYAKNGERQCFDISKFRPLDETFAEEVLENIKQQIEEEELILNN